ncbi:MAG: hypothetical protein V7698_08265 [Paracoccaceae bacterium]
MPNGFAYLMLALWPIVSLALFRTQPPGRAIIGSFLIAYLFLPPSQASFDLPLMPEMNKDTLPAVVAFVICLLMYGRKMRFLPEHRIARILILVFVFSPIATAMTNPEAVFFGRFGIQGLGLKEGLSMALGNAIAIIPFVLAMNFLRAERDLRDILLALVIGCLIYSLPMLFEVRMSPQLNTWIYGFFQHSFGQMIRGDGYRPIVFLYHGLWVAFFCFSAVIAALALYREDTARRRPARKYLLAGIYLFAVLVLCKSLGSLIFAVLLVPAVMLLRVRVQLRIAAVMVALAMFYPVLKGNYLVPERELIQFAYSIEPERAGSLQFRLLNEAILLDRAALKPVFGWGGFGRGLIFGSDGRIVSIPDGRWVITLGSFGWVGFLAEFGLLMLPVWLLLSRTRGMNPSQIPPVLGGVALILGANMVDMLPNATLTPLTWLMCGAVMGYCQSLKFAPVRHQQRMQTVM